MNDKLRINPWYLVFTIIGVAILHALYDLIHVVATRNVYVIQPKPDANEPAGAVIEGAFEINHDPEPSPSDRATAASPRVRKAKEKIKEEPMNNGG